MVLEIRGVWVRHFSVDEIPLKRLSVRLFMAIPTNGKLSKCAQNGFQFYFYQLFSFLFPRDGSTPNELVPYVSGRLGQETGMTTSSTWPSQQSGGWP